MEKCCIELQIYKNIVEYFEKEYGVASVNVLNYTRLGLQSKVDYYRGIEFAYLNCISQIQVLIDELEKRVDSND